MSIQDTHVSFSKALGPGVRCIGKERSEVSLKVKTCFICYIFLWNYRNQVPLSSIPAVQWVKKLGRNRLGKWSEKREGPCLKDVFE